MSDEDVMVVEQGSFEAQRIAKAMSSPTSSDLYNQLSLGPMSATALAEKTKLPLTTVKYHLKNLLDAGLIEIEKTKWSVKGREMKIYRVIDRVVILAPRKKADIKSIAEKYGTIAGVIALASSLVLAIPKSIMSVSPPPQGSDIALLTNPGRMTGNLTYTTALAPESIDVSVYTPAIHTIVQGFLITSLVILFAMMIYELYKTRCT